MARMLKEDFVSGSLEGGFEHMAETQGQRVYRLLRESISSGDITHGTQVNEGDLSREFNVSRTPVREATLRLEHEGVLVRVNGRLVVASLSYGAAADLYTTRAALEGMATYIATQVASQLQLDALDTILTTSSEAIEQKDFEEAAHCNAAFHKGIEELASNLLLSDSIRKIDLWTERYRRAAVVSFGRADQALADHRTILSIMRLGSASDAESAMKTHVLNAGASFLEALRLFQGADATNPASIALETFDGHLGGLEDARTPRPA